jgi:hypothetical protein
MLPALAITIQACSEPLFLSTPGSVSPESIEEPEPQSGDRSSIPINPAAAIFRTRSNGDR